jgi:hypothetical protein
VNDTRDRDNALSRLYREGAWPEPSRQIDQAILAASRRALKERWPLLWRWGPPFAVAATVVVTGSLVLMARDHPESGLVVSEQAPGAIVEERPGDKKPEPPAAPPPPQFTSTPPGYTTSMDAAEAERVARAQRDLDLKQSPPASESPVAAPARKAAPAENFSYMEKKADEPKPSSDALVRQAEPTARTRATVVPKREEKPAAPTFSVFGAAAPAAPAPAPTTAPAPTPAPAPAAQAAPAPAPAAIAPVASPGVLANRAAGAPEFISPPQNWVEVIRKLKADGKAEEATRNLAEFRKYYPDYPLPEDLR